jgi:photosystem I subunit 9
MAEQGKETNYLITFLSTAPVAATIWLTITAGILIEFNRFFPDLLFHPLP